MAWFWIVAALAAAWCERIWLKFPCRSAIWFSYCLRFQNVLVRGTKMTTKTVFSECLQVSKPSRIGHHLVDICFFEAMPMRLLRLLRNLPHSQRKAQLRNQKLLSWEVVISSKFQSILSFLHHPCRNFPTQAVALLFVAVFSRSLVLKSSSQCIHTNHWTDGKTTVVRTALIAHPPHSPLMQLIPTNTKGNYIMLSIC